MERKKTIVVLLSLFLLTGCHNNLRVACSYSLDDKTIDLDIKAHNDDISSISVRTSFEIPQAVICDKERFDLLNSQLDNTYHFENNLLVREYDIEMDDTYSLKKTIDDLNSKRFYCE